MFSSFLLEQHVYTNRYPGLQRMMSFALADDTFAKALINDPVAALDFAPAGVALSAEEYRLVTAMPAGKHLAEFATRLCTLIYLQIDDCDPP